MLSTSKHVLGLLILIVFLAGLKYLSETRFSNIIYQGPLPYDPFEMFVEYEEDAGPEVSVFLEENMRGQSKEFKASQSDLRKFAIDKTSLNDNIRSLKIGPFTKVTLYEHINFAGKIITYENKQDIIMDIPKIDDVALEKKASSIKVELYEPHVIAYTGDNLGGLSKIYSGTIPVLSEPFNKKIVSLKFSPHTKVTVFAGRGYKKESPSQPEPKEFINNTSKDMAIKFVGSEWAKNIASMKVEKLFRI